MTSRDNINSGDLLIWENSKFSVVSNFYLNLIRLLTRSPYAHVAIAWRMEGRLYIVEATQPLVRLTPVRDSDEFFHVSMDLNWSKDSEDYLIEKIGTPYSLMDAGRALFGKTLENDNRYQCAELCNEFYSKHGFTLENAFTPTALVETLMERHNRKVAFSKSS